MAAFGSHPRRWPGTCTAAASTLQGIDSRSCPRIVSRCQQRSTEVRRISPAPAIGELFGPPIRALAVRVALIQAMTERDESAATASRWTIHAQPPLRWARATGAAGIDRIGIVENNDEFNVTVGPALRQRHVAESLRFASSGHGTKHHRPARWPIHGQADLDRP